VEATADKSEAPLLPRADPDGQTLAEVGGGVLVVSQFTLAGSLEKGNRPDFARAARPDRPRGSTWRSPIRLRQVRARGRDRPVPRGDGGRARQRRPVTFVLDARA
jgi:hypothetical protein